ncbi:MAG TPA: carboxypeptidase-like regulatory domain-containing protein [Pyrinomonadaceae bacterium]|nr:carboxypeptidase-like regulatory domain-containing protein [Pyrinomonadaceae bacterium]
MPTLALERTKANPKRLKSRAAPAFLFVLFAALHTFAQAQRDAPATVAGRVTNGDHGVAGVSVMLTPTDQPVRSRTVARAKTDGEGRYRMTNVPPGRYQVIPFAPAYVVENMSENYPPGKTLTLSAGDTAEDVDFRIERGGVITGRITDADGNPLIGQQVLIALADPDANTGRRVVGPPPDPRSRMTDDRGVYRVYGLPAGRYHVSAGSDTDNGAVSYGRRRLYKRTFYPEATDESQAQVVEVSAGGEAENIDIKLGNPVKTYKASGRFVDAATGQPVPNVAFGYGTVDPTTHRIGASYGGVLTDANGEFAGEGFAPGHYAAFAFQRGSFQQTGADANDFYSDPTYFDVVDSDVTGIVVTLKHGSTLDGVLTVEGSNDRAAVARIASQLQVYAYYVGNTSAAVMPNITPSQIAPDGSFHLGGLRPGTLRVMASSSNVTLLRVELNGANVTNGVEVSEGAQISGVRLVVAYGNAVIYGQVNYLNGRLPQDAYLVAIARRTGGELNAGVRGYTIDSRGRFRIEGLAAGEYDVTLQGFSRSTNRQFRGNTQHVSVADGGDTTVTLTLDLGAQPGGIKP